MSDYFLVLHVKKNNSNQLVEELMILANIMNLCEINPKQVYKWFMEMFVDSSDWVMSPNVYGMGLFSDGGIFATKPYICGSSYFLKMMHFFTQMLGFHLFIIMASFLKWNLMRGKGNSIQKDSMCNEY